MHTKKPDAKYILFQLKLKEAFRVVSPVEHYHHLSIKMGTIQCSKSTIDHIGKYKKNQQILLTFMPHKLICMHILQYSDIYWLHYLHLHLISMSLIS